MLRSPLCQFRKETGLTIAELSKVLKTKPWVIGRVEAAKIRLPVAFIDPLERTGATPFSS